MGTELPLDGSGAGDAEGAAHRIAALKEQVAYLEEENQQLRRLLNDPDRLLQRGLRILASMRGPVLNVAVALLQFWERLAHLTAPISPWW